MAEISNYISKYTVEYILPWIIDRYIYISYYLIHNHMIQHETQMNHIILPNTQNVVITKCVYLKAHGSLAWLLENMLTLSLLTV